MKSFLPYDPYQPYLLPPSPLEWLPKDHPAYFISDLVDDMDLSAIYARYEVELRGHPPYHPKMMVKVLIYAYCHGIYSSRAIERALYEDIGFRFLAAGNYPDHNTISDFRKDHLKAFRDLFVQVLLVCARAGMVKLGHVALDGTKIKANASKHKAMSYGRMKEEIKRLEQEIDAMVAQAEAADRKDTTRPGRDRLPEELAFREKRLKKIREAKEALEAEAKAAAEASEGDGPKRTPPDQGKRGRRKRPSGVPEDRAQRNFTDPDSKIMPGPGKQFIQGYNAQAVVDAESQVIVATHVTNQTPDCPHLVPMLEQVERNLGRQPAEASADAAYYSEDNLRYLQERGIEPFIPPAKIKHSEYRQAPVAEPLPEGASPRDHMMHKLRTERGRERYKLRQTSVEPTIGQIKGVRGFRQFSLRGLEKVQGEWFLVCLAHNVLKLYRRRTRRIAA